MERGMGWVKRDGGGEGGGVGKEEWGWRGLGDEEGEKNEEKEGEEKKDEEEEDEEEEEKDEKKDGKKGKRRKKEVDSGGRGRG